MEDKALTELLKTMAFQSPGLVTAIVLAWMFMKHLTKRQDFEKEMHDEHLDERSQARQAAQENGRALLAFTSEIQKNTFEIQRNTESNKTLTHTLGRNRGESPA